MKKALTADHAYKIGRFLGWYYSQNGKKARIVIGKDTRRSSYMFEYTIVGGIVASGADAYLMHVTTTPSVAYIARVGDKNVYKNMKANGYNIGGEQSGHIIFSKYASTGDDILTSLKLMQVMIGRKKKCQKCRKDL